MSYARTLLVALGLLASGSAVDAQPLGTVFTYQGQLTESAQPATGLYDLQVCLFDSPSNPAVIACASDFADVPVDAGVFALALDFGAAPFVGQQRFLELRVRPGASTGAYTILAPRQVVRPTPEALRSNVSSAAPWSGLTGVPAGFIDGIDNDSGGTVTSVTAGTGLVGGNITGSGTIGIANGGVGAAQIASGAVGTSQLASGAVTGTQLAINAVGAAALADNAVDTGAVQNLSITQAKIAAGAVGTAQINPAQVQVRIIGTCAIGEYFRGVNPDGSVACESVQAYLGINLTTTVDNRADLFGGDSSIAIGADGLPVISYYDSKADVLKVARCNNTACTGVATITTVDNPANDVGSDASIAIGADGLPVISYQDRSAFALKVAKCANAACTGVATITTVDNPANNVGFETSIAIGADGLPVISYRDSTAGALKVARCNNAACTGVATITTVDGPPANSVGFGTSIAIGADGLPVISYYDSTADALKVARCNNTACTGVATITTVDNPPANNVGSDSSIAIGADGLPVISYRDDTAFALKVARCNNAACTGVATITTVDNPANSVGLFNSIAIGADGLPVISYHDSSDASLKVATCANAACTGEATITTVDGPPANPVFFGTDTSIAIGADGLPVISYKGNPALRVAKCGTRSCQ